MVEQNATGELSRREFARVTLSGALAADSKRALLASGYPSAKLLEAEGSEWIGATMGKMEIRCNLSLGLLESVRWAGRSSTRRLHQQLLHYHTRGSGAYIFDPTGPAKTIEEETRKLVAVEGSLYAAVHTLLPAPFRWQTVSLTKDEPYVDHVTSICLTAQHSADEFAIRYGTDLLQHNATLWTDINGWPTVSHARVRYTDPQTGKVNTDLAMAANFHPMIAFAALEDHSRKDRFTILSRSSSSVATLDEGSIEVMLDRQTHNDDGRGLGEPLMDSRCFERALRLYLSAARNAHARTPLLATRFQFPVVVATTNQVPSPKTIPKLPPDGAFSLFKQNVELPANVHLLSMRPCLAEPSEVCMQLQHTSATDTSTEELNLGQIFSSQVNQQLQCSMTGWEAISTTHDESVKELSECSVPALKPLDIVHLRLLTPGAPTLLNESIITWEPKTRFPAKTTRASATVLPTRAQAVQEEEEDEEAAEPGDELKEEEEVAEPRDELKEDEEVVAVEPDAEEQEHAAAEVKQEEEAAAADGGAPASEFMSDVDSSQEETNHLVLPSAFSLVLQALAVFLTLVVLAVFVVHPRLLPRLWRSSNGARTESRLDRLV